MLIVVDVNPMPCNFQKCFLIRYSSDVKKEIHVTLVLDVQLNTLMNILKKCLIKQLLNASLHFSL